MFNKKKIILALDCIVGRKTFSKLSYFFSATFAVSLNISTCSYVTYYSFKNKPMVKCSSTNALI